MENKSRAGTVGVFVFIGLAIIGGLIVNFSKGASLFKSGYSIVVRTKNVGGLRAGAPVVMSGVPVGSVKGVSLSDDGRTVLIECQILSRFVIRKDADFEIEQSGFLGDQFVSIVPVGDSDPALTNGGEVTAREPFNLQEAARSAMVLMQHLQVISDKLNSAVTRVDRTLLSEAALSDLTNTIASIRHVSSQAENAIVSIEAAVTNATPGIGVAMTNMVVFSQNLNQVATEAKSILLSNEDNIHASLANLRSVTDDARLVLNDLEKGKGVAGGLLKDESLRLQMNQIVTDFGILSSNLSRHGILWKPRDMKPLTNALHQGRGDLWK